MTCHTAMWLVETPQEQRGVRTSKDFRQAHSRDGGIQTQPISTAMVRRSVTAGCTAIKRHLAPDKPIQDGGHPRVIDESRAITGTTCVRLVLQAVVHVTSKR